MISTVWPVSRLRKVFGAALIERARRHELSQSNARKRAAELRYNLPKLSPRPIVLDVYYPQNLMHLAPLYAALKRRGSVPIYAAVRDAREETRVAAISRGIGAEDILMGDSLVKAEPALTVACDQSSEWLHRPVPGVPRGQIFHGCILKSYAKAAEDLAKFDHFFFPGPLYLKTFEDIVSHRIKHNVFHHNTGMPRTDDILRLESLREEALVALGLDPAKKTILYAPTWHLEASFVSRGEQIAQAISELGLQLLLRPHPVSFLPTLGRASKRACDVLDRCSQLPGVVLAHDKDDRYVMAASDMMIADYGSIAYEYLILNRPLVFFECPEYRQFLREDDLESWGRAAGAIVTNTSELREAIREGLAEPGAQADIRKDVLEKIYFNLGRASEACCDVLERLRG